MNARMDDSTTFANLDYLQRRRIQTQSLDRQLERIGSGIAARDVQIETAALAVGNVDLGHDESIAGGLARGGVGGILRRDLPDGAGEDLARWRDDAGAAAGDVF